MTFDERCKQATAEWEALQQSDKPRIIVGMATCGRAAGAAAVFTVIRDELSRLGIEAAITEVGCIGMCFAEPLVDIIKPGRPRICYENVTSEIMIELIEDYLVKDNPRPDLAMGTSGDGEIEGIPKLADLPHPRHAYAHADARCRHGEGVIAGRSLKPRHKVPLRPSPS